MWKPLVASIKELHCIDMDEDLLQLSYEKSLQRSKIKSELLNRTAKEEIFLRQKCELKWHLEGDENTQFFHNYMAAKWRKNTITEIISSHDISLLHEDDIVAEFISFYKLLYTKKVIQVHST